MRHALRLNTGQWELRRVRYAEQSQRTRRTTHPTRTQPKQRRWSSVKSSVVITGDVLCCCQKAHRVRIVPAPCHNHKQNSVSRPRRWFLSRSCWLPQNAGWAREKAVTFCVSEGTNYEGQKGPSHAHFLSQKKCVCCHRECSEVGMWHS